MMVPKLRKRQQRNRSQVGILVDGTDGKSSTFANAKARFSCENRQLFCAEMASQIAAQMLSSHNSPYNQHAVFYVAKRYQSPLNDIITRICLY